MSPVAFTPYLGTTNSNSRVPDKTLDTRIVAILGPKLCFCVVKHGFLSIVVSMLLARDKKIDLARSSPKSLLLQANWSGDGRTPADISKTYCTAVSTKLIRSLQPSS